jgi:putative membrane protein
VKAGLVVLVVLGLLWSGWAPSDRFTWWLEVAPVLLALPILLATARRFPLTPLLCVLLAVHAVILMVGGHWTYAEVPAGFWVKDALHLARNPYDRLGHLAQGFVPAILARELLWRRSPLRGSRWLPPLVVSVCLAISACYELLEWRVAVATGEAADAFLGTQGDVWDTQWDMALAGLGAVAALLLLSRLHERQLASSIPERDNVSPRIGGGTP